MNSSRRVWKWTSAVLAVLCAVLGICHFLLTQLDEDSSGLITNPGVQTPAVYENVVVSPPLPPGTTTTTQADQEKAPDSKFEISDRDRGRARVASRIEERESQIRPSRIPKSTDDRQPETIQTIKPLGVVEKAGGRLQAVIQEGEWTRLVEAGEVLADNSRVVKVTAEGVEILRSDSHSSVEWAHAATPAPNDTKAENVVARREALSAEPDEEGIGIAEAVQAKVRQPTSTRTRTEDGLPGMQTGEATLHAAAPKRAPSLVPPRPLKPALPSQTSPAVAVELTHDSNAPLGRVEYAGGRVQTVIADGQWVKLVGDSSQSRHDSNPAENRAPAKGNVVVNAPIMGGGLQPSGQGIGVETPLEAPPGAPVGVPPPGPVFLQPSTPEIPNSVEPIGIVEWPGGRTRAIVTQGMSVSLVDDAKTLAEARRTLAVVPSPEESGIDPRLGDADLAGRQREDELASLALTENESPTRGPPGGSSSPPDLPEQTARGQPEDDGWTDLSRGPPVGESGIWLEDDLPGIEDDAAARTEPLQSVKFISDAILGRSGGASAGSVSKNQSAKSPTARSGSEISANDGKNNELTVLGYVRMSDGRQRAIIASGDSVALVDQASEAGAASAVPPSAAWNSTLTGHPPTDGVHQTAGAPSRPGLQFGPRIRDNQIQPHR